MRRIKHIVVHCSATVEGRSFTAKDIDRWHKQRGWLGNGYHYVIGLDGTVEKGRPDWKIGAHVKGHNRNSIGVVYIGGLDKNFTPKDTRTQAQKEALCYLLKKLRSNYPEALIVGHRDFSKDLNGNGVIEPFEFSKSCPCFDAKEEYKYLK
ncbi:N-acetylmuramoyl-L-alanine amidase [Tenacibaculum maritimum]|uniref:N-acetylmuramoyl-L-alanine amidase n=2 Tax=Tenacibaculum maritimum TaxID=107401 RepID=UPI0012E54F87|nr:N-acetylmuramoyl-L-alanine amidase [Tenacibaculum maritimum]CAA0253986.1 N-acetylmuramoyl-L-alanine amidase [Tenacibaculum maritimum]